MNLSDVARAWRGGIAVGQLVAVTICGWLAGQQWQLHRPRGQGRIPSVLGYVELAAIKLRAHVSREVSWDRTWSTHRGRDGRGTGRIILNLFGSGDDDKEAPHVTPASPWTSRKKSINMELAIHKCSDHHIDVGIMVTYIRSYRSVSGTGSQSQ